MILNITVTVTVVLLPITFWFREPFNNMMIDSENRATPWRPFFIAINVAPFIKKFLGSFTHILGLCRVIHYITKCSNTCHLSTNLEIKLRLQNLLIFSPSSV